MKIRNAELSDIEWIIKECESFADAYGTELNLAGNLEYGAKFLETIVSHHLVLISEVDGERTGFIAGMIQPHHFNPDIVMLSELLWWVSEKHRGGSSGAALLDEFIAYGKENCNWITFTMEKNTPISDAPLLKRGFECTEKAYLLECK